MITGLCLVLQQSHTWGAPTTTAVAWGREADLVGSATRDSARWPGEHGMNLMGSTILREDTGASFDQRQPEQIAAFRDHGSRRAGSTSRVFRSAAT
jgi:hypothetical protein